VTWLRKKWCTLKRWWRNRDGMVRHPAVTVLDQTQTPRLDWGVQLFGIPELWHLTKGAGIKVGVIDTGCDLNHPALRQAIVASEDFSGKGTADDGAGHGTHVAGIIGARPVNGGTVGVAPECQLYIAKALGDDGSGDMDDIVEAIHWLIEMQVDIINVSLGSDGGTPMLKAACELAAAKGIMMICAAGNDGVEAIDDVDYPGRYESCIAVGAVDRKLNLAAYTSVGPEVDILAPGSQVYSTYPKSSYALLSGTSMATPFVSGVAALALAKERMNGKSITTVAQLNELFKTHAMKRPDLLQGNRGLGIIDPAAIFQTL
jgi:subtilisin family serine protease